jgi:hypothetical protein
MFTADVEYSPLSIVYSQSEGVLYEDFFVYSDFHSVALSGAAKAERGDPYGPYPRI